MKVYKFGGASVRNADGVRNLRKIIDDEQNLFIIVSAMGKTTNALEKVFEGLQKGDKQLSMEHVAALREYHAGIIDDLWRGHKQLERVDALFDELERVAVETVYKPSDAELWYDTIVAFGELVSTTIISEYLNYAGVSNRWIDMRRWPSVSRISSSDRALSAVRPTARPPRWGAKARTTRRPWWPISSTPSRWPCGRTWTAC